MNYCENCGKELNEGMTVCPECGVSAEQAQTQNNYSTQGGMYQAPQQPQQAKEAMVAQHKYSMAKFKKGLSIFMIIATSVAMLTGLIALIPMNKSYFELVEYAKELYIDEVNITYTAACLISGFYQTVLLVLLLFWIYLFRKSAFQKKLYEATGQFE